MAKVIIGPVSTGNEDKSATPTWHKASIRKEQKEGDEAGLPKDKEDPNNQNPKADCTASVS